MKVLFLTRYDAKGASSRVRCLQYLPWLQAQGMEVVQQGLLSDGYVVSLYEGRTPWREVARCYARRFMFLMRRKEFDLIWIEKELFPFLPAQLETFLLRGMRYVIDMDDAIFHQYDQSRHRLIRGWLGQKIDTLMSTATLVVAGNSYLASRARASGAPWVERLPSVIDLRRYTSPALVQRHASETPERAFRIVWIGSPATVHYLEQLRAPMVSLAQQRSIEFRVIGAPAPVWPGVSTRTIEWHADTEAQEIAQCDVGVMPLENTPWEQGKCSFKLIQYMACGLPVVASPVGMNVDVLSNGSIGILASTHDEWAKALEWMASHATERSAMGNQGRRRAEERYCLEVTAPLLADHLTKAAK